MKKLIRNWKYITLFIGGLTLVVYFFAPSIKEKVTQIKAYVWVENYKRKYSTPKEIEMAKTLPAEATMADIYRTVSPIFNEETFNRVGKMQELLFAFILGKELDYSKEGKEANEYLANGLSAKSIYILNKKGRDNLTIDELELLGISYLRLGEQQNCIQERNQDSCLFPIRDMGIHKLRMGGEEAMAIFKELQERVPERLDWRWLYNISAMAVGLLDENVPANLRVLDEQIKSNIEFPRFPDVAKDVGIVDDSSGGSVIVDDFNNDGNLDIVNVSNISEGYHNKIFFNDGKGHFVDKTKNAGLAGIPTGLNMTQVDYNNDGFLDIFVLRGGWMGPLGELPDSLLKNNGNGTFTEVTKETGLLHFAPSQAAAWADFDNDGDLDLFIGNESSFMKGFKSEFYENLGDGKFKEISDQMGLNIYAYVKGAIAFDYNNDGWEDLAITDIQNQKAYIYKNLGKSNANNKIQFVKEAELDSRAAFSLASFDYDNDGWADLIVPGYQIDFSAALEGFFNKKTSETTGIFKLFKNDHGKFRDVSKDVDLNISTMTMGLNYGDIDNDGFIDFFLGTGGPAFTKIVPNKMFRNNKGIKFQDVTTSGGFGNLQKGHGIGFGDVDNDGQLDVYISLGGVYRSDFYQDALYHNPGNKNRWVKLKLRGIKSNRFGVGSKVKVTTDKGAFYRHVDTGGSFGSNTLTQHIGLGESSKISSIEITWPGQNVKQIFKNVALDSTYEVQEGAAHLKNYK